MNGFNVRFQTKKELTTLSSCQLFERSCRLVYYQGALIRQPPPLLQRARAGDRVVYGVIARL